MYNNSSNKNTVARERVLQKGVCALQRCGALCPPSAPQLPVRVRPGPGACAGSLGEGTGAPQSPKAPASV